jgi:pimeloyl-ACP methyl ester carboxylesterase
MLNRDSVSEALHAAGAPGPGGGPEAFDLALPSGRLRALGWGRKGPGGGGADGRPLVVCVHGLSANARSFDAVAGRLAREGRRVVALDLRGRGQSEVTGPGSYGWEAHARDVLEAASRLAGSERFDLVGHSMGAFVSMQAKALAPARIRRLVLIDAAGSPEPAAIPPILAGLARLGPLFPSADAYVQAVRAGGTVSPWGPVWEAHYRHELEEPREGAPGGGGGGGGVRARTSLDAVQEDLRYAAGRQPAAFWPRLDAATLLVRAGVPLTPEGGDVLRAEDFAAFAREVRGAATLQVDANHYGVMTHAATLEGVAGFLG